MYYFADDWKWKFKQGVQSCAHFRCGSLLFIQIQLGWKLLHVKFKTEKQSRTINILKQFVSFASDCNVFPLIKNVGNVEITSPGFRERQFIPAKQQPKVGPIPQGTQKFRYMQYLLGEWRPFKRPFLWNSTRNAESVLLLKRQNV